jgi:DNA-binding transcriptional regulator YiaG
MVPVSELQTGERAYQVMPDLSDEQYKALKGDIAEHGVLVPVMVDENNAVIDGFHRVKVCQELGIETIPCMIGRGFSEEEKREEALRLNYQRRHLSRSQIRAIVMKEIRKNPTMSDRQVAALFGVSATSVGKWRGGLTSSGQVSKMDTRTGSDGKKYHIPKRATAEQPPIPVATPQSTAQPAVTKSEGTGGPAPVAAFRAMRTYPAIPPSTTCDEGILACEGFDLPADEHSIVFFWVSNNRLWQAFSQIEKWEFEAKTMLTLELDEAVPGPILAQQTVHCIVAFKGTPEIATVTGGYSTIFHGSGDEANRRDTARSVIGLLLPETELIGCYLAAKRQFFVFANIK